jgi:hypothetical protein
MSSALDHFEQQLVAASRRLNDATSARPVPQPGDDARHGRRLRGRVRRLTLGIPAAVVLGTAVTAVAAGGVAAYVGGWFTLNQTTHTITSFTCETTQGAFAASAAITGDPLTDCAAFWPADTLGRHEAPALAAWAPSPSGPSFGAVVTPASAGPPSLTRYLAPAAHHVIHVRWSRLPVGWTLNVSVIELTDQLNDIPSEMANPDPSVCTTASRALRLVHALLADDHLTSWHVVLRPTSGPVAAGCHPVLANVDASARTVQLAQGPSQLAERGLSASRRELIRTMTRYTALYRGELASAQQRVNASLAAKCSSVETAAALWRAAAGAAGFQPTSLAYFRAVNARRPALSSRLNYAYTLLAEPASEQTGACARILVLTNPGGAVYVYAARMAP